MADDRSGPKYQSGFGGTFESEALAGALPRNQNSPRPPPLGLCAEQINGTGFAVRRSLGRRTWVYRIRPSVVQSIFESVPSNRLIS